LQSGTFRRLLYIYILAHLFKKINRLGKIFVAERRVSVGAHSVRPHYNRTTSRNQL
jgi:hypothetical protein